MYRKAEALIRFKEDLGLLNDKEKAVQIITKFDIFEENEVLGFGIVLKNNTKQQYMALLADSVQITAFKLDSFSDFSQYLQKCIETVNEHFDIKDKDYSIHIEIRLQFTSGKPLFDRLTTSAKKLSFIGDEVAADSISYLVTVNKRHYNIILYKKSKGINVTFGTSLLTNMQNKLDYLNEIEIEIEQNLIPNLKKATKSRGE